MEIKLRLNILFLLLFSIQLISIFSKDYLYRIPIVYNIEISNVYPTLVSVSSILENSSPNSQYVFYLLTNNNNIEDSIKKQMFTEIANKYKNSIFHYIDFSEINSKYPDLKAIKIDPLYYILFISDFIEKEDKVIFLHGDTIALEDLHEMISIDIEDKYYYLGWLDFDINGVKYLGIDSNNYINTGVMLINLKKLKEKNMIAEYIKFFLIHENNHNIAKNYETVINAVNYQNIGLLPPRFGLLSRSKKKLEKLYQEIKTKYDSEEYKEAINDPALIHYCGEPKPWNDLGRERSREWWFFVNKTYYADFIYSEYGSFFGKKRGENTRSILVFFSITSGIAIIVYYFYQIRKMSNT